MHHQAPAPYVTTHFGDGDVIRVGGVDLKALHTPGHTPDSASLHGAGRVFTGDALLIGGTGRTDFAGGDAGHSFDSITTKIFALPDDTIVLPAHDYRCGAAAGLWEPQLPWPHCPPQGEHGVHCGA